MNMYQIFFCLGNFGDKLSRSNGSPNISNGGPTKEKKS